ncbi:putative orfan [Tupanvirus soda lake]|uniref:Orfan n=2 Tax=Tupanvirus TaxID=2094720 RepID=A0AC62ACS2_9VIRU|nr:putative orfan [Tupanvirus soda lake]QKU35549.1 putative orfan [Tupanvirus soda lake]
MNYSELIGKRIIGFMPVDENHDIEMLVQKTNNRDYISNIVGRIILFIGEDILTCKRILLVNDKVDYDWNTNWRIIELGTDVRLEMSSSYKSIGENINAIEVDSDDTNVLENDNIDADMDKWIAAVGKGNWGAKDGADYYFIHIKTNTKILSLGTVYCDCHYPQCIWDFI